MEVKGASFQSVRFVFNSYILNRRENLLIFFGAILFSIIELIVFKYYYVHPNFIHGDSFVYIGMAMNNPKIGTYPIGYPMFLRLFSVFSKSDLVLISFQYVLLQCSLLYACFSIFCLFKPRIITKILVVCFIVLNPINLFLSNLVSTDSIFLALSLIWFTQLVWIIVASNNRLIFFNSLLLVLLFMIRYNALFYPILSIVSIIISRSYYVRRILGLLLSFVLIFLFVRYTSNDFKRLTGIYQFSPFSGWQLANNAMYSYRYVDSSELKTLPKKFSTIDKMVRNYFDSTRDTKKFPAEMLKASTVYMWDPKSPLSLYAEIAFKNDTLAGPLKKWATAAPMMKEYGVELIKTYPDKYFEHYIIPNSIKYYTPPVEFLEYYNNFVDTVPEPAKIWFNYDSYKLHNRIKDFQVQMFSYYPIVVAIMNVVLVFISMSFFLLKLGSNFQGANKVVMLILVLWLINLAFSILASPIALRFQLFPIIVEFALTIMLCDYVVVEAFYTSSKNIERETLVHV